jgi:hypothetical protein
MRRYDVLCAAFFLCFFLLFCSGRLASGDAGTQLQAAMLLVNTGKLGTSTPPTGPEDILPMWVRNQHGDHYQAHDIGNVIFMTLAAAAGSALSGAPATEEIQEPPILSRVAVSMTFAFIGAVGCFFMFKLFSLFRPLKTAFLLSLAFATTTFFWAYAKSAWDVMGGCVGVCVLLYLAAKILHEEQVQNRTVLFAGGRSRWPVPSGTR